MASEAEGAIEGAETLVGTREVQVRLRTHVRRVELLRDEQLPSAELHAVPVINNW